MYKNQKTSLSLELLNFFGNCSVTLWKKTKVLCKRHATTRCTSMPRNSRWDKLKWHPHLRWQLHIKLVSVISPRSWEQRSLVLLRLQHFWLKRERQHAPRAWLHRVLNSANRYRLPRELQKLSNQQDARCRWTQMETGSRDTGCN